MIQLLLQAALCSVLLVAIAGKIADREGSIRWIAQLGLRRPAPLLVAVLGIEAAIVLAVAFAPNLGALAGLAFIAGASVVLRIAKGKGLDCACFGPGQRVTARSFVRNGLVAAGFLALAVVPPAAAGAPAAVLAIAVTVPAIRAVLAMPTPERVT